MTAEIPREIWERCTGRDIVILNPIECEDVVEENGPVETDTRKWFALFQTKSFTTHSEIKIKKIAVVCVRAPAIARIKNHRYTSVSYYQCKISKMITAHISDRTILKKLHFESVLFHTNQKCIYKQLHVAAFYSGL